MSGIGCSSKTPAYFVEQAHGFNGVHGRMPSAATGAKLANRELMVLGISGDGDTASIGLGQFCHMIRRNVDCTYIIEDNGCYGLTKGQFSATADVGSTLKNGTSQRVRDDRRLRPCDRTRRDVRRAFVLRRRQATRSAAAGRIFPPRHRRHRHHQPVRDVQRPRRARRRATPTSRSTTSSLHTPDYIAGGQRNQSSTTSRERVRDIELEDGSHVLLRKLDVDYDPTDSIARAADHPRAASAGELVTGLLYVNTQSQDLCERERLPRDPLAQLEEEALRIGRDDWEKLMHP